MLKVIIKILLSTISIFIAILMIVVSLISSLSFRQWTIKKVNTELSKEFGSEVSIGNIRFEFPTNLFLYDLKVKDQQKDTVFFVKELKVDFKNFYLSPDYNTLIISKAEVNNAVVKFIKPDSTSDWNYEFFFDYFNKKDTTRPKSNTSFTLKVKDLILTHTSFEMVRKFEPPPERSFNENDFKFYQINSYFTDFTLIDDSLSFIMDSASMKEKNGFVIKQFQSDTRIASTGLEFYNLNLQTAHSTLRDTLLMNYHSWDNLSEFLDSVQLYGSLNDCIISPEDINYFGGDVLQINEKIKGDAKVKGTVNNLSIRKMKLAIGNKTYLQGYADLIDITDIDNAFFDLKLTRGQTYEGDIANIFGLKDIGYDLKKFGIVSFEGKITGLMSSFTAYGNFKTDLGNINTDIQLNDITDPKKASYSGKISLTDYDLGESFEINPYIKKTSLSANIKGEGLDLEHIHIIADGEIGYIQIKDYTLNRVKINGELIQKSFAGKVRVKDENLDLNFDGNVDFSKEYPAFDFTANIKNANLLAFHFDTIPSVLNTDVKVQFSGLDLNKIDGFAQFQNFSWKRNNAVYEDDTITLSSHKKIMEREISFTSKLIDVKLEGNINPTEIGNSFINYAHTFFPTFISSKQQPTERQQFTYKIDIKRTNEFLSLFNQNIEISPSFINGTYNERSVFIDASFDHLKYEDFEINQLSIGSVENTGKHPDVRVKLNSFKINDSSIVNGVDAVLGFNKGELDYHILVSNSLARMGANLKGKVLFYEDMYSVQFDTSSIYNLHKQYYINRGGEIEISNNREIAIKGVELFSENEKVVIEGNITNDFYSHIRADIDKLDVGELSALFNDGQPIVNGIANGTLLIYNIKDVPVLNANLQITDVAISNDTLGDFIVKTDFNQETKIINIEGKIVKGKLNTLDVSGTMNFNSSASKNWDLQVNLNETPAKIITPFTIGLFSEYKGKINASMSIVGKFSSPKITGNLTLTDFVARIDYLNTYYSSEKINVEIDQSRIVINKCTLKDKNGRTCSLEGKILHDNFDNMYLSINVTRMNNLMVLNTTLDDNDLFYGNAYFTGVASITGPLDNLLIEVTGKNGPETEINLPLDDGDVATSVEFIRFVNGNESYVKETDLALSGLSLKFNLEINDDAIFRMIFDSQLGDIIQGSGNGIIQLDLNTYGDFKMYGTFVISKGSYLFTALDVINKPFTVKKGGTISWNGDPLGANINIEAVYTARTSPMPLVSGTVEDENKYNVKMPVEAILNLRGNLMNPDIKFGLNFPDLSQLSANSVSSQQLITAIRRIESSQEETSKQVFSLLVFNSFVTPSENLNSSSSGISGSSAVGNNIGSLVSAQLTNWLNKIDPNWNVGVNYYQSGNSSISNREELIVSTSKQVLNNRLRFDASYDAYNSLYNVSSNYLITPNGNNQIRVFSKNTSNVLQTTTIVSFGGGFYFRREFEDFSKFRKRILNLVGKKEEEDLKNK